MKHLWLVVLGLSFTSGCSPKKGDSNPTPQTKLEPIKSGEGDATLADAWPNADTVDLSTKPLLVYLDYTPSGPGKAVLTKCLDAIPDDTALGIIRCDDSGNTVVYAKHVQQFCSETDKTVAEAKETLAPGCDSYQISAYQFKPALRFDVK